MERNRHNSKRHENTVTYYESKDILEIKVERQNQSHQRLTKVEENRILMKEFGGKEQRLDTRMKFSSIKDINKNRIPRDKVTCEGNIEENMKVY